MCLSEAIDVNVFNLTLVIVKVLIIIIGNVWMMQEGACSFLDFLSFFLLFFFLILEFFNPFFKVHLDLV